MTGPGWQALGVSRETYARLERLVALLEKWSARINLVARSSLNDVWIRHVADSLQLWSLSSDPPGVWAELGSGGGFPGLVCACMAADTSPETRFVLVESDARKAAFLRAAIRETGVNAVVETDRIEKLSPIGAGVVSARALADLGTLLSYAERHLKPEGTAIFPKGARWQHELEAAKLGWSFDVEAVKSSTDENAVVLKLRNIRRV